jgi:hypothetical protein
MKGAYVALLGAAVLGCSGPSPKTPNEAPAPAISATPHEAPTVTVATGKLPGAERTVRVNGTALRASPLLAPLVGLARGDADTKLFARAEKLCGFSPVHAIDDAVFSQGPDGWLIVAKVGLGEDETLECVGKLGDSPVQKKEGRGYVHAPLFTATVRDGVLVVGNDNAVTVFLASPTISDERHAPELREGELLRGLGTYCDGEALCADTSAHAIRIDGALKLTPLPKADGKPLDLLEAHLGAELTDAEATAQLQERLESLRDQTKKTAQNPRSIAVLESFRFDHHGRRLGITFGTQGDGKALLDYVDFLVSLYGLYAEESAKSP